MTATELWQFNACYLAKGIRDGSFTCEEVMLSVVERISNCNQKLNAIVYDYSDHALSEAIEADKSLAKGGQIGALYGVPVTVKTNIDVKGQPTPNGIRAYESIIAEEIDYEPNLQPYIQEPYHLRLIVKVVK